MRTILITGTTGFLGSALAASLLNRGHRVVSLSRNDADGSRTRAAISRAASGFSLEPGPVQWANLKLLECQYADLGAELAGADLSEITEVWHCAAHMSYSPRKLDEALRQNLQATTELYEVVRDRSPWCRRFHHVSTAYTAGIEGGAVPEALHPRPRLVNSYQISKWCAEQALSNLGREPGALPVTLFRPTIIVGHSRTGWSPGNRFGYFMFVHALSMAAMMGIREVTIDLAPGARPNLVPMDQVVAAAVALTERAAAGRGTEIFHCANPHQLTTEAHLRIIGERLGVRVRVGTPRTIVDQRIAESVAWNREFASTTFDFGIERLLDAIGPDFCREPMTEDDYRAGVDYFVRNARLAEAAPVMAEAQA
jgi:nucleoside-diphosphate-sugar epimerase